MQKAWIFRLGIQPSVASILPEYGPPARAPYVTIVSVDIGKARGKRAAVELRHLTLVR